jgi:hypothetical protein
MVILSSVVLSALGVLIVSGCGGSRGLDLSDFRRCLAKDQHFAVFIDGASTGSDFALRSLPSEARSKGFVALVSGVSEPGLKASRQGVVFVLLREKSAALAKRWGAFLAAYKIYGENGEFRPRIGRAAYAWVLGQVNPPPSKESRAERARWVRLWGRTQQHAARVWLRCVGVKVPPNYPPAPTS